MSAERVLIYRIGSLGDTVVALPCFQRIARSFPTAEKILLTNVPVSTKAAPLQAILGGSGFIDHVMAYPIGTRSPAALWRLARDIRALHITTLVYLAPARGTLAALRDLIYFRLCGVRRIVGLPLSADLQHNRVDPSTGEIERECERLVRTVAALGPIDLQARSSWDLRLTPEEVAAGRRAVQGLAGSAYIAINMGGKAESNDWGVERWRELLPRVAALLGSPGLLIVGSKEDTARAQVMAQVWPGRTVDACGQLSPRESAAALGGASLFIGHDSGPMHLAAASGVPCVGLFGDSNLPKKWHPFGAQHCNVHRTDGIAAITVDEVVAAVTRVRPAALRARGS